MTSKIGRPTMGTSHPGLDPTSRGGAGRGRPDSDTGRDSLRVFSATPTEKQHKVLLTLGSGSALLTGKKRDIEPLVRRGWVTADHGYAWVRITTEGLHALARGVERFGLPEMKGGSVADRVCAECDREWRPKCKCGSGHWRYKVREVERV